jgi:hypothetical protein
VSIVNTNESSVARRPNNYPALLSLAALVLMNLILGGNRFAFAEQQDLMEPLLAESASLNNHLLPFVPQWQRGPECDHLSFGFGFEKALGSKLGLEVGGEWERVSPRDAPSSGGFGNIDVAVKYVFLTLPKADFGFAVVPSISFPTASNIGGEHMSTQPTIELAWGGRLSKLPEHGLSAYLRPIEIQGDFGYARTLSEGGDGEFFFDPVIDYSMPYYANSGDHQVPWIIRYLCPFIGLNFAHPVGQGSLTTFMTPGVSIVTETYQLSAGAQLALNPAAARDQQVAVVGSLRIFLESIDSRFARTLF